MLFSLLFILSFSHKCIHDQLQIQTRMHSDLIGKKNTLDLSSGKETIRLTINTSQIFQQIDPHMCKTIGQVVTWTYGTFKCEYRHMMTEEKLSTLNMTFQKLTNHLQQLLKVDRLSSPFTVRTIGDITITPYKTSDDLHITAVVRPFEGTLTLASAFSADLNPYDKRPITGGIYINAACIPDTFTNDFYQTVFHETCHILAISSNLYSNWINPLTQAHYNPVETYTVPGYPKKTFYVITGPYSKQFAKDHFNITRDIVDFPVGIIIEDQGGTGTALSHPKELYYLTDVMQGFQVPPSRISNVTLSLLADSGWYEVNFSMAEPFPYGNGKTLDGKPLQDFISKPPRQVFPSNYMCDSSESNICTFDFMGGGKCPDKFSYDCSKSSSGPCSNIKWYDPNETNIISNLEIFDYQLFPIPYANMLCYDTSLNQKYAQLGMYFSNLSMCALSSLYPNVMPGKLIPGCFKMTCTESSELYIHVDKQVKKCDEKDEKLKFFGYAGYVVCPDPNRVCRMRRFLGMNNTDPGTSTYNLFDYEWVVIVVCCVFVIVVFFAASLYCCIQNRIRRRKLQQALNRMDGHLIQG